jgi:hypothetical protein
MTVSSTTAKVTLAGNDSTTTFNFSFTIYANTDLVVTFTNSSGVESTLSEGSGTSNYSVSVSSYPGSGSITWPASGSTKLQSNEKITIKRVLPLTQTIDLQNQGGYFPDVQEQGFDRGVYLSQQIDEEVDRSIKIPVSSATSIDSTLPAPTADTVIGAWNSDADAIVAGPTVANITAAESNAVSAAASAVTAAAEASAANPKYTFSTTTSMADPGAGTLRYNHGTVASVSAIAIDDTTADTGNPDIEAWIASWDDSTSTIKGWLRLVEPGTPANYAVFHITGLTNNSGWVQLAVTHIDSNGTFGNGDSIRVMFSRTGDKGETGSTGSTGSTGPAGPAIDDLLTTRGDIAIRNASEAVRLAIGSSGRALLSDGTDPSWGQVSLTAGVTGTLPAGNGGTGVTSLGSGTLLTSGAHVSLSAGISTDIEDMGSSGTGTETVDLQLEALKTLTITGSSTFAPDASRNGIAVVLVTNDGTGGYSLTTSGWDHVIGEYDNTASKKHLFTCYSFGATDILRIEALS